jgi:electron transfer flavoprotein alpha/beta subunit
MKIVCLVKQVPQAGAIQFDEETKTLRREGVPLELNPFDRFAVRHAVALGDEVVAMSMGPPQAEEALREALALGADRAVLLSDRVFAVADTLGTSRTLSFALRKEGFDLIICGKKAIDAETWQVPPEVAAFLGVPHLTGVVALEPRNGQVRATRATDDADEVWDVPLPALVSVAAPPDVAVQRCTATSLETWGALDLVDEVLEYDKRFGQTGSPTRVLAVRDVTPERARFRTGSIEVATAKVRELLDERPRPEQPWEKPGHSAEKPGARYDCWALIETRAGTPTRTSLELLARARQLAGKLGGRAVALALSDVNVDLARHGAEVIHRVEHNGHDAAALREVLERHEPHVLLIPATAWGREVGPRAAGELELGMTGDCVGVDIAKAGRLLQQKPAYGGNIVSVIMGATTPQLATVRPRMYEPLEPRDKHAEERTERIELPPSGLSLVERRPYERSGTELEEADTVLLLGERAPDIELDVATGVTGQVVERGDAPRHLHVGLLGRAVAPRLLIAVGVPGDAEQRSGIVKSAVIVSVDGGDELNEHADVIFDGDARALIAALT